MSKPVNEYMKYTTGFVAQHFKRGKDGKFECVAQSFTAGVPVEYEDMSNNPIDPPDDEVYQSFDMVVK